MSEQELPPCCQPPPEPKVKSCCEGKKKRDWLLLGAGSVLLFAVCMYYVFPGVIEKDSNLDEFITNAVVLLNKMWVGLGLGIVFVGLLAGIPKSLIFALLGRGNTLGGILRAAAAGVLLDLCSHGVLLIGMQLYRKGASVGQVMAFLIASPWNSLSMTVILWSLVGLKWTLVVIGLSLVVALITGVIFDKLAARNVFIDNPYREDMGEVSAKNEFGKWWRSIRWNVHSLFKTLKSGFSESKMLLKWIFLGVILSALIRTFVSAEIFQQYFGPTLLGLGATLLAAMVIEVCSEGSLPIASDFILRASAPGNTFAFLMTGVATDYTEILALRETTGSWKIALFLPLLSVPQVIILSMWLNGM